MTPEIITRDEAKARGLLRYFTGKPCKRGHIAQRAVSNHTCWDCIEAAKRAEYAANPGKAKAKRAAYFAENRDSELEKMRAYAQANGAAESIKRKARYAAKRDILRKQSRDWARQNPAKRRAQHAERKARQKGATPPWYGEWDKFVMEEAALLCFQRIKATGIDWHVDHMIPLRARKASGLHCAANFQVIPAVLNISKRNKMILTQPLEWLKHI